MALNIIVAKKGVITSSQRMQQFTLAVENQISDCGNAGMKSSVILYFLTLCNKIIMSLRKIMNF
jgi:hypothetical protein